MPIHFKPKNSPCEKPSKVFYDPRVTGGLQRCSTHRTQDSCNGRSRKDLRDTSASESSQEPYCKRDCPPFLFLRAYFFSSLVSYYIQI